MFFSGSNLVDHSKVCRYQVALLFISSGSSSRGVVAVVAVAAVAVVAVVPTPQVCGPMSTAPRSRADYLNHRQLGPGPTRRPASLRTVVAELQEDKDTSYSGP